MRYVGKITTWKDDKGFGFITIHGRKDKIFVHINAFENRLFRPTEGDDLTFEITRDEQGRSNATKVRYAKENDKTKLSGNAKLTFNQFFAMAFFIILLSLVMLGKIPFSVVCGYVFLGVITFLVYYSDKYAAQNKQQRTPEDTLHFMSLIGGWLGASLAQYKLRHKSKKESFQLGFKITTILNCAAFVWSLKQGYFEHLERWIGF